MLIGPDGLRAGKITGVFNSLVTFTAGLSSRLSSIACAFSLMVFLTTVYNRGRGRGRGRGVRFHEFA